VDGKFAGFHVLVFDIAWHKHRFDSVFDGTAVAFLEIDISRANELLRGIASEERDPISMLDKPGLIDDLLGASRILNCNDKAALLFKLAQDRAVGFSLAALCSEGGKQVFAKLFSTYLSDETTFEAETTMKAPDGELLDVSVTCAFPKDSESSRTIVLGASDIRVRLSRERELARAQADLAHAARVSTLGELMASITHEVNQPLAAIAVNANAARRWLSRAEPNLEEAKAAIQSMIDEAERASQIIVRTRKMASKGVPERISFPLNEMVRDTAELVHRQLASLGSELLFELARDLPNVEGDRIQLQQVLINLMVNAGQAMAQQTDRQCQIIIRTAFNGAMFIVDVQDQGPGVPIEEADQLFEAFYTTKQNGMGMGLSIARSIVEAHGGTLSVHRVEPRGALFRFTLPH
jgi:C4-dicarboxylate-specific signal transduction histidine kinase